MDLKTRLHDGIQWIRSLLTNRYFWAGIGVLAGMGIILYVLVNYLIMPAYTRHGESVVVPNVVNQPISQAESLLKEKELRIERVVQRFNPSIPADVVIDQNPAPNSRVKPKRRIFLTINSGVMPKVIVPSVEGLSLREAMNRLKAVGLEIGSSQPDTIPAPFANTVTRQVPAGGDSLAEGGRINLWYSTGLGTNLVTVPDVTSKTLPEAIEILRENKLRYIVIHQDSESAPDESFLEESEHSSQYTVTGQRREPGSRVREGSEIRLYVEGANKDNSEPAPEQAAPVIDDTDQDQN